MREISIILVTYVTWAVLGVIVGGISLAINVGAYLVTEAVLTRADIPQHAPFLICSGFVVLFMQFAGVWAGFSTVSADVRNRARPEAPDAKGRQSGQGRPHLPGSTRPKG